MSEGQPVMRAKMQVADVDTSNDGSEILCLSAVCKASYDEKGLDENNTFAKFTPSANLSMTINNPALHGKFEVGQDFYVDFTRV